MEIAFAISLVNTLKFWKYKWRSLEGVYERDPKYFRWLYYENRDKARVNEELDNAMKEVMKKW